MLYSWARARSVSANEPPVSSSSTAVWYWLLNGITTTVIYDKRSKEIWCNGYVLAPVSSFVVNYIALVNLCACLRPGISVP